jgi:hypothetical protein
MHLDVASYEIGKYLLGRGWFIFAITCKQIRNIPAAYVSQTGS